MNNLHKNDESCTKINCFAQKWQNENRYRQNFKLGLDSDISARGDLHPDQFEIGIRAEIIFRSSAKIGIVALIDEATGYIQDKDKEEYRELFKQFLLEEYRGFVAEFPDQFFDMIYDMHKLPRKHKNKHPQFFGHFFRKYVYFPLANSNGVILEMLDEKNPVIYDSGGRRYKMHSFFTEVLGLPTLRAHYWQLLGSVDISI